MFSEMFYCLFIILFLKASKASRMLHSCKHGSCPLLKRQGVHFWEFERSTSVLFSCGMPEKIH